MFGFHLLSGETEQWLFAINFIWELQTALDTKKYSTHRKIIARKLASLESVFQYESNDTNYVEYNQNIYAQILGTNLVLENVFALFIETEIVSLTKTSWEMIFVPEVLNILQEHCICKWRR